MATNATEKAAQGLNDGMAPGMGGDGILELYHIKVRRIMMPSGVTVTPDFSVGETLAVLHRHRLRAAPVVDGGGRMMGIVTLAQIDRLLAVLARQRQTSSPGRIEPSNFQALPPKGGSHAGKKLDAPEG